MADFDLTHIPAALWPIKVLQDKFGGKYCGGPWIAYADNREDRDDTVWNESQAGYDREWKKGETAEVVAARFWKRCGSKWWIAVGKTPNEAVENLIRKGIKAAPLEPADE
jgi:hypothetical protein